MSFPLAAVCPLTVAVFGTLPTGASRCLRGDLEITVNNPIRLYMSMSLDGFIAGPDDRAGQELGRGGGRLSTGSTIGRATGRAETCTARRWAQER